jgi:hypothetical protein
VHTRRVASFLLGTWIAGCLFMAFISVQNLRTPSLVMSALPEAVAKLTQQIGWEQMAALIHHAAAEETRRYTDLWVDTQLPLGLTMLICLALATQRRILPMVLCGVMLVVVLFQFRVAPELIYQGRGTDFPPGSNDVGLLTRFWALQQVFYASEIVKLLCGGVLASYLFVFRTTRRKPEFSPDKRALSRSER